MVRSQFSFPWVLLLLSLLASRGGAATITVDLGGHGDFVSIHSAVAAAGAGDTVLVKPGEYVIDRPIDLSRAIKVRAEAGPETTILRMSATPADPGQACVVIFTSYVGSNTLLDGFTITGGRGAAVGSTRGAGGIVCAFGPAPTISRCIIEGNTGEAGGIFCRDSSPTFTECIIRENVGTRVGGVLCLGGALKLNDCTILENEAPVGDTYGALLALGSEVRFTQCTIRNNRANRFGGVVAMASSSLTCINCGIDSNGAGVGVGGGLHGAGSRVTVIGGNLQNNRGTGVILEGATATLESCTISNSSYYAMSSRDSSVSLIACTLSGNGFGAVEAEGGSVDLTNCLVDSPNRGIVKARVASVSATNCSLLSYNGGLECVASRMQLLNCIVWATSELIITATDSVIDASYSCIKGDAVWPGEGNINQDPRFERWPDRHLRPDSPAIDAGAATGAPARDLEGNGRPCGAGVDMGAYESGYCWSDKILDNGDPGTWSLGYWTVSGAPSPYGAGSLYSREAGASYHFSLNIEREGFYEVALWWPQWPSRSTAVPVDITSDSGVDTVFVDQRSSGGKWAVLGIWKSPRLITVRSMGAATTSADAVKLRFAEPAAPPPGVILDNGQAGTRSTGRWSVSGGSSAYGPDSLYSRAAGDQYVFELTVPEPGAYDVSLWWSSYASRCPSVPVEIRSALGTTRTYVDQRWNNSDWDPVGTFQFDTQAVVIITATAGCSTCADAVRIVGTVAPPSVDIALDNGEPGTSFAGDWDISGGTNPFGASSLYTKQTSAWYRFEIPLPTAGQYEVYAWWSNFPGRCSQVEMVVSLDASPVGASVIVDQTLPGAWYSLGTYRAEGAIAVTVHGGAGGSTCADAVRVRRRP